MGSENSEQAEEIERIKNRLIELVEGHFSSGDAIVHVSRLGNELGPDRLTLERLTGTKLGQYLRENLPQYPMGGLGPHKNVLFLAPPGTDPASLPRQSRLPTNPEFFAPAIPRYISRFWAAFAKPLSAGEMRRFIDLSTLTFGPDPADLQVEDAADLRTIEADYIAPQGASGGTADTAERISRWLQAQNLDGRKFTYESRRSADQPRGNLLTAILHTLTAEQLKRTVLPLDVVKALSEQRRA